MADVAQYGLDALAHIRKNVIANLDITEGLLFGIDTNGKAILADATTPVKAQGIVVNGSEDAWGAAKEFNKVSTLREGRFTDVNKFAIVDVTENTYSNLQIGAKLYLGVAGAFTLTENVTVGEINQPVGYVLSRSAVLIDVSEDTVGAVTTASNFDVVEITVDGVLAIAGIGLVTTGAAVPVALSLAAPEVGTQVRVKLAVDGTQNLVITTATGVTFDGTNNTATFADALDELVLGYKSATEWVVIENIGAVALSAV